MTQVFEVDPNKQYILCGDISASMNDLDPKCAGQDKYHYMLEKFKSFIKASEDFDPDGPTILLFGEHVTVYRNTTLDAVSTKLDNINYEGYTNTHLVIDKAFELHREEKADLANQSKVHPGTVLLVFTDGAPTNRAAVERSIVKIANSIDKKDEFSICFLTVGTIAPDLKDYLNKLDDGLRGTAKYDIVTVHELENISFMNSIKAAIA